SYIRRRKFLATLGGAVAAWPLAARAQQPVMPVIGFVRTTTPEDSAPLIAALRQGLGESGFIEGRNVAIEYRYALNQIDRLPALMAELVERGVTILAATGGTISARAAKAATTQVPGLIVTGSPSATLHRNLIITLAARHKLPAIYYEHSFADAGGLISYGPDFIDQCRRPAGYVARILTRDRPADLPVQAPTKYELVINL